MSSALRQPEVRHRVFRRRWPLLPDVLGRAARALFFACVLLPVASLLCELLQAIATGRGPGLRDALPDPRTLGLLARSLGLAAAVACGSMGWGVVAASTLWGKGRRVTGWLLGLLLATFGIPGYVHALAWTVAGPALGLGSAPAWVRCLGTEIMLLAPLGLALAIIGLGSVAPALIEAGRITRPDAAVVWRVILPGAAPCLAAAAALIFALCLTEYAVPSLFGLNVYSLELFAAYSADADPAAVLVLAWPLVVVLALALAGGQRVLGRLTEPAAAAPTAFATGPYWSAGMRSVQWLALAVLMLQVGVPFAVLIRQAGSLTGLASELDAARHDIVFSLACATAAALIGVLLAGSVAPRLAATHAPRYLWPAIVLPLVVPAPLVGIGLIVAANRLGLHGLQDTAVLVVLAALSRFGPLAALIVAAAHRRVPRDLREAAQVFSPPGWRRWLWIEWPLQRPGYLAAGCVLLTLALGELGATLIVMPPGYETVTVRIYNYLHYGASDTVAGLCLLMAVLTGLVGAAALLLLRPGHAYTLSSEAVDP